MIEKVKNTVPWIYVINDLSRKVIVGRIYENELQKKQQQQKTSNSKKSLELKK